jgi:hypothetical protein
MDKGKEGETEGKKGGGIERKFKERQQLWT